MFLRVWKKQKRASAGNLETGNWRKKVKSLSGCPIDLLTKWPPFAIFFSCLHLFFLMLSIYSLLSLFTLNRSSPVTFSSSLLPILPDCPQSVRPETVRIHHNRSVSGRSGNCFQSYWSFQSDTCGLVSFHLSNATKFSILLSSNVAVKCSPFPSSLRIANQEKALFYRRNWTVTIETESIFLPLLCSWLISFQGFRHITLGRRRNCSPNIDRQNRFSLHFACVSRVCQRGFGRPFFDSITVFNRFVSSWTVVRPFGWHLHWFRNDSRTSIKKMAGADWGTSLTSQPQQRRAQQQLPNESFDQVNAIKLINKSNAALAGKSCHSSKRSRTTTSVRTCRLGSLVFSFSESRPGLFECVFFVMQKRYIPWTLGDICFCRSSIDWTISQNGWENGWENGCWRHLDHLLWSLCAKRW